MWVFPFVCSKMTVEAFLGCTHSWTPGMWKVCSQYWHCFCCTAHAFLSFFPQALAAAFLKEFAGGLRECMPTYSVTGGSIKFFWVNVHMLHVGFNEVLVVLTSVGSLIGNGRGRAPRTEAGG